ncbi:hypothetical protein RI129_000612 [Pyrocoelia pectoralis]|uniref:Uncharacterized protein n=1 Tax=Pyrocoelia pectoralis TaxID=417401 RepID=A0AAN7ZW70_9COLE
MTSLPTKNAQHFYMYKKQNWSINNIKTLPLPNPNPFCFSLLLIKLILLRHALSTCQIHKSFVVSLHGITTHYTPYKCEAQDIREFNFKIGAKKSWFCCQLTKLFLDSICC